MSLLLTPGYDVMRSAGIVPGILEVVAREREAQARARAAEQARAQAAMEAELQDRRRTNELAHQIQRDAAKDALDRHALNAKLAKPADTFPMLPTDDAEPALPEGGATADSGEASDAPLGAPTTGDTLNLLANQGEANALPELSLAQPSPFRNETDFAGVPSAPSDPIDAAVPADSPAASVLQASDGTTVPKQIEPMAGGMLSTSPAARSVLSIAARYGGGQWDNRGSDSSSPDGLPSSPGSIARERNLMPESPAPSAAAQMLVAKRYLAGELSPAARSRINLANQAGGPKSARAALARELSSAATAERTAGAAKAPTTRTFADGSTRQYNATSGEWETLAQKPSSTNGEPLTWQGDTAFTKGGKAYRYDANGELQPVTSRVQYGSMEQQIEADGFRYVNRPGFTNVVSNSTGTALLLAKTGANGKVIYTPFSTAGKIARTDQGAIVRIGPDNTVSTIIEPKKIAAADEKPLTEAMQESAEANEALTLAEHDDSWFAKGRLEEAQKRAADADRKVRTFIAKYPHLRERLGGAGSPLPAASDAPAPAVTGAESVYRNEAEARSAGHKAGDVITVLNPATGKPARARLN